MGADEGTDTDAVRLKSRKSNSATKKERISTIFGLGR